jgi:hypothetical protein
MLVYRILGWMVFVLKVKKREQLQTPCLPLCSTHLGKIGSIDPSVLASAIRLEPVASVTITADDHPNLLLW